MCPLPVDIVLKPRQTPALALILCWDYETSECHTWYYGRDHRILVDLGQYFAVHRARVGVHRRTVSLGDGGVDLANMGVVHALARLRKLDLADGVDGSAQGDV